MIIVSVITVWFLPPTSPAGATGFDGGVTVARVKDELCIILKILLTAVNPKLILDIYS